MSITTRTIRLWVEKYEAGGVAALQERRHDYAGRPEIIDDTVAQVIRSALTHYPDQLGYQSGTWTISLLRHHISRWSGEAISDDTIRRYLHRLGYIWKRPRYILKPDPQRRAKLGQIREKIANLPESTAILFEDETDLLLFPPLRSAWVEKGISYRVPIHGGNEKRVIFGAINIRTGNRLVLSRAAHRAADFQFFLRLIRWHYRRWNVVVLLDEDPSHKAVTTTMLARGLGIELVWLPKRAPELNPMELLWGKAKDIVCANRQYADMEEQVDQFIGYIQDLQPIEALNKTGLSSESFWLWQAE